MYKKVFYNTTAQVISKIVTASGTLIITLLIAKSLGAAGYGDFTKIFVFVGYFYTLSDFGLNSIFIKLSNKDHKNLFRSLVGLRLIFALVLTLSAVFITFFLPYNHQVQIGFSPLVKIGITIASLTIITQSLLTTANALFQKNLRYELSTIAVILGTLVILSTVFLTPNTNHSLLVYVWAYIFGGITFVAVAFFLIFKKFKQEIRPQFTLKDFQKLLTFSWPVGLALIFNLIYFRIDVFILSVYRSSQEVGVYGLAFQFFEASLTIPIFFANSLYPLLSNLFNIDRKEFAKQVKFWLLSLTITSFVFTLSLIAISFVIPLFFGSSFNGASRSLRILAIGTPFFYVSAILWFLLIIYDKQKYLSIIYAVGALFNVLANLVFVPKYGYIASSIITVVSEALITLLLVVALKLQRTKRY